MCPGAAAYSAASIRPLPRKMEPLMPVILKVGIYAKVSLYNINHCAERIASRTSCMLLNTAKQAAELQSAVPGSREGPLPFSRTSASTAASIVFRVNLAFGGTRILLYPLHHCFQLLCGVIISAFPKHVNGILCTAVSAPLYFSNIQILAA